MFVYRVEHLITDLGPYQGGSSFSKEMSDSHTDESHPNACRDCFNTLFGYFDYAGYEKLFAGFETAEQCIQWFDNWFDKLHDAGFVIKIYESSLVHKGIYQVLFDRAQSTWIDSISIPDFLAMMGEESCK